MIRACKTDNKGPQSRQRVDEVTSRSPRWPGFPGNDENVDTFRYALDSIKSVILLSRADYFVGSATSCFSRLVYQLRIARGIESGGMGDGWTVDSDPRYREKGWIGWFMDP